MFQSKNPIDGSLVTSIQGTSENELAKVCESSKEAYASWSRRPTTERAHKLLSIANTLRERKSEYGRLMALEMGKPISEGVAEAEKCAWVCEFYAENAARFLSDELIPSSAKKSYVAYRPIGSVLAIMPWNFPFWQVFRAAAPAISAGNTMILKHAENVVGCAREIQRLFDESDIPTGVFQTVFFFFFSVAALIENPVVQGVTLTGSTRAGREVAQRAGRALKKTVLELGGSDPYVVLADADLEHAVSACVTSRMINNGQSCIAAKRFIVEDSIAKAFIDGVRARLGEVVMGDPLDESVTLGPLARPDLRDALHEQVSSSVAAGARALLGGQVPEGPGAYYPATLLVDVEPGMAAFDDELFGPVASVIRARSEEEAIRLANQSSYGLGAAVFTADVERGERIAADELNAGACFVNDFVRSDPRLPFGGIRDSGYGRELAGHGIREFANAKTVYLA
ncbi:MAG: NAD-dependent succinate-semialdehyde dehydrogenase [Myxococcales bacterium]|nr:NAD-dependent succinate-semialdehyde dehydrogenase [Myxococcales bacterium]